jgi:integrase
MSNALARLDYEHLGSVSIGNSFFEDDTWDLSPLIPQNSMPMARKKLNFKRIKSPFIRDTIKRFILFKLGRVKATTAICVMNSLLPYFVRYCENNSIHSFSSVTPEMLIDHASWLRETVGIAKRTGYMASFYVEELISVGQMNGWDVPKRKLPKAATAKALWGTGRDDKAEQYKPIPSDILAEIIDCALNKERNLLTRSGIIIQSQTGLRIGEVLSLKSGCLNYQTDGQPYFEASLYKTAKGESISHKVLANELVVRAIEELELKTAHLRELSGYKELFLHNNNGIHVAGAQTWSKNRLRTFIRKHGITDTDGTPYKLKSHQFRATFVKQLVLRNIPLAYVMKQYAHVSIEMTAHYLDLKENEIKEVYSNLILAPDAKIAGYGATGVQEMKDRFFRGKHVEDTESVIRSLASSITFNPLPGGMCLYDYRRGNCTNGDGCFFYNCPAFVTETSFLPVLKKELELMDQEMERTKSLGYERQWQIQHLRREKLFPLVQSLEEMAGE